jgi:ectoine hydroxylase-related dioxygenase (phytanoyl-CoA dioxygenase family)
MEFKSYGASQIIETLSETDLLLEEIDILGYTVVKNVIPEELLSKIRLHLDQAYQKQEDRFGKENLIAINELNLARCLLAEDDFFLELATKPFVLNVVKKLLGDYFVLHLQNGVINRPNKAHHQSSWHRDLPYQDYVISQPIAVNAFWCIDDFSEETGSTILLPYSHNLEKLPSLPFVKKNQLQVEAPAGSIILFNSMLYHCAGFNRSNQIRRGINHVYVSPILKQQISLPLSLGEKYKEDAFLSQFLGYQSQVPSDVDTYRTNRLQKKNK